MRRAWLLAAVALAAGLAVVVPSARPYPPGSVDPAQLGETQVMALIADALKEHVRYAESVYNSQVGHFGSGRFDERGVRTNADYALTYAFLYSRFPDAAFAGVPRDTVRDNAVAAIRYGYRTHRSAGGQWGYSFQSSLWAQAFGMAAWLLWDELPAEDRQGVEAMITGEADHHGARTPPTNEFSDTKAEENAWDTNVLALGRSMFPADLRAGTWDHKVKEFAMNTFSLAADEDDQSLVDGRTVADWVLGPNLHPDFTLENHGFFHPEYEMGPIWLLTESAVYYARAGLPVPAALRHHVRDVWENVMKDLELGYAEEAYPLGVDWDIHRAEQLEGFAALATLYGDVDAKFLESRQAQYLRARQRTTADGSFMLNPDVGELRHAVLAHQLVYAHLFHDYLGAWPDETTDWPTFRAEHATTKLFPDAETIRGMSADRWAGFSWRHRYMGMVYPDAEADLDNPYVAFPFREVASLGNFTGLFDVAGASRTTVRRAHSYSLSRDGFATAGRLATNQAKLNQDLAFVALPGNAVVYLDTVLADDAVTVTAEGGVPLGIESDTIGGDPRTLYHQDGSVRSNGSPAVSIPGTWANVDHRLGLVMGGDRRGQEIWFGNRAETNSVRTARLYGSRLVGPRSIPAGGTVAERAAVVYSNIDASTTEALAEATQYPEIAPGWRAVSVPEPDGRRFLVTANFTGERVARIRPALGPHGAPVLTTETTVSPDGAAARVQARPLIAQAQELGVYIKALSGEVEAVQGADASSAFVHNDGAAPARAEVSIRNGDALETATQQLASGSSYYAEVRDGSVTFTPAPFPGNHRLVSSGKYVSASSYQAAHLPFDALDGDPATYWAPQHSPGSLTVDLQGEHAVDAIAVRGGAGRGPREVLVEASSDGRSFVPVTRTTLPDGDGPHTIPFHRTIANHLRLTASSAHGPDAAQVAELEVYGRPTLRAKQGEDLPPVISVTADSVFSPELLPENVLDGDLSTFWASANTPMPHWVQLDLGRTAEVGRVIVRTRRQPTLVIQDLDVATAAESTPLTVRGGVRDNEAADIVFDFPAVSARTVRVTVSRERYQGQPRQIADIAEVELYDSQGRRIE